MGQDIRDKHCLQFKATSCMVSINITLLCSVGLKSHISNAMVVDSEGFTEGADSVSATSGDAEAEMSSEEREEEQEEEMVTDDTPAVQKVYIHALLCYELHRLFQLWVFNCWYQP